MTMRLALVSAVAALSTASAAYAEPTKGGIINVATVVLFRLGRDFRPERLTGFRQRERRARDDIPRTGRHRRAANRLR